MAAEKGNKYALFNKGGAPALFSSAEEIINKLEEYFNLWAYRSLGNEETEDLIKARALFGNKPTIVGLALFLGFASRQSLYDYMKKDEFSYPIKRAISFIEMGYESMLDSKSCTGAIFALKNMGWKDKNETDITSGGEKIETNVISLGAGISPENETTS